MKFKQYQFRYVFDDAIMCWIALHLLIMLPTVSFLVSSYHSRPSFRISHTNVVATLNSDRSLDLKQAFVYHGSLSHGPEIVIDPGNGDSNLSIRNVTIKKGKRVTNLKNYFKKTHDQEDLLDGFDDEDAAKSELEKMPNTYGYYYDDNNRIHIMINDPLKAGQSYQAMVKVRIFKEINKHGVIKYNILGSANQVDLGSVDATVINHTNGLVNSYYMQNLNGAIKYGSKLQNVTLKLPDYKKNDHLDLRTNMSYKWPLLLTRLYRLWFFSGLGWLVLIIFVLVLFKVLNDKHDVGSSMGMPDIIFSDLISAIYLTTGSYDSKLLAGLITRKELIKQVFNNKICYQQTELERKILSTYGQYARLKSVDDNMQASSYLADSKGFEEKIKEKHAKLILSSLGIFGLIILGIMCLVCWLEFVIFISVHNQFTVWIWWVVTFECLMFLMLLGIEILDNSISMFLNSKQQTLHVQLLRLANGLSDVGEIQRLHIDNAALWTDLVAWAVGIGLNTVIIDELKQRGYELGFLQSADQADAVLADVGDASSSFSSFVNSSDGGFGSSGGGFGGGDAGGGSGAGSW